METIMEALMEALQQTYARLQPIEPTPTKDGLVACQIFH
jgi:hypothetical protein